MNHMSVRLAYMTVNAKHRCSHPKPVCYCNCHTLCSSLIKLNDYNDCELGRK